jgi:hypothetical protein
MDLLKKKKLRKKDRKELKGGRSETSVQNQNLSLEKCFFVVKRFVVEAINHVTRTKLRMFSFFDDYVNYFLGLRRQ